MKFSINWLREFVDFPKNPEEIAELLTRAGVETENIETRGASIDKVIVSQITASSCHPNADRLTVCEVDDSSEKRRQIVCGATNYKVGDKVPLALPGAKLPTGTEIRKSKLRGVESEGMLCSAIELGLGENAAGLLILSPEAKIGAPISDLFPSDTILDIEITPNRGDLLSHFGLAREIAALLGQSRKLSGLPKRTTAGGAPPLQHRDVTISALQECPFYSARKIDKVKVGPSPEWLRAKIESVGVRSINNIVDISNFVMLELGQPTHAFDADKLRGEINVRLAREGEKFLALDGNHYSLGNDNLVIADDERVVGIAGVMGGEDTGVTESTKNILLESAYFLPASIRRTARNLNLPSDASYRFERGVDPVIILRASERATGLMRDIAGGNPEEEIRAAGEAPRNPADVSLNYARCNQVLGTALEPKTVDQILKRFGLSKSKETDPRKDGTSTWRIPSYRRDLRRDVDLIEEVVRAYGVNKIPGSDRSRFTFTSTADRSHDLETSFRNRLADFGLSEARTSKLIPRSAAARSAILLRNPLSEDHVALRPSLLPGLLAVLGRNVRAGAERVALFELGRIFVPPDRREERHLGLLLWGNVARASHWRAGEKRKLDFFDLKGAVGSLPIPEVSFRRNGDVHHGESGLWPNDFALTVKIFSRNQCVGRAGQLSTAQTSTVDVSGAVFFAELDLEPIEPLARKAETFHEIGRFPEVTRDIAMIVPESVTHAQVMDLILSEKEPLLETVELFDLFTGELGEARKSLAYRLTYRDRSRTLTSEEVAAAHAKIRERLQRELSAELRE